MVTSASGICPLPGEDPPTTGAMPEALTELGDVSMAMQSLVNNVSTALRDFGSNFSRNLQQLGNKVTGVSDAGDT